MYLALRDSGTTHYIQQSLLENSFIEELAGQFFKRFSHRLNEFEGMTDSFKLDWFTEWVDGILLLNYSDYIVKYVQDNYEVKCDDDDTNDLTKEEYMEESIDFIIDSECFIDSETGDCDHYKEFLTPVAKLLIKKVNL